MDKKELEKMVTELEIEKRVEKRVRYHCVAFWSVAVSIIATMGSFASDNSVAFNAAIREFIRVWMSKP